MNNKAFKSGSKIFLLGGNFNFNYEVYDNTFKRTIFN